jgi:hypothetical protein
MTLKKKFALAAVLVVLGALASLIPIKPTAIPDEPLPNPNGYEDFVKGAAMLSQSLGDATKLPIEELRPFVATNQPALEIIRTGLAKSCQVIPYQLGTTNNDQLTFLGAQKRVAHAFVAASRLALFEARTNDAAIFALDCTRFGAESSRGGVVIDDMVGLAIRSIGLARLQEAVPGTDTNTVRVIIATLDNIAARQETCEVVFNRERHWMRQGRFGRAGVFNQLIHPFLNRKMRARTEQKFVTGMNTLQHTKLRAAAHAYELDHAKPPATARDLVPQYLKSVPLDATTGQELPLN